MNLTENDFQRVADLLGVEVAVVKPYRQLRQVGVGALWLRDDR